MTTTNSQVSPPASRGRALSALEHAHTDGRARGRRTTSRLRLRPWFSTRIADPRASLEERRIALLRAALGAFLVVGVITRPTGRPLFAGLAASLLCAVAAVVLLVARLRPHILAQTSVQVTAFALDSLVAVAVLLGYSGPGSFAWMGFIFLVLSGAARWEIGGAAIAFALFLAVDMPMEMTTAPGGGLHLTAAGSIKVGFVGMATAFFGLQWRTMRHTRELAESETRTRALLDNVVDGIITFDERGCIESSNPAAHQLFGRTPAELQGAHLNDLLEEPGDGYLLREVALRAGACETAARRHDGSTFPVEFRVNRMRTGARHLFVASVRDISERKAQTAALEHLALHDTLTALPNRTLFGDRLRQAILARRRDGRSLVVLLMDLDGFKDVNDSLGHHVGDRLLQEVAARVCGALRQTDTVARLGGDEFAVLPGDATDVQQGMVVAQTVLDAMETPFVIEGHVIHTGVSIGLAVHPDHGEEKDVLLRRADVAMYVAKRGRRGYAVYAAEQDEHSARRLQLVGELRQAIERDELVLHYQPKVRLSDGCPVGVEALVRWQHPQHGLLLPGQFIPGAEDTGLIRPLTEWVLGAAVRQLRKWSDAGIDLRVAVNLSARNLEEVNLPDAVTDLLRDVAVPAERLVVEITESTMMAAFAERTLHRLHALGIGVSIDDFGMGYSSLAYLRRLPVDEIKIDRSFIVDMIRDGENSAIVRSTIDLGHNLGLRVVTEGVEDAGTLQRLAALGCDAAQGFHLCRPLPAAELERWWQASDRWATGRAAAKLAMGA